ncbi:murein hydrolase activator EnvC family protein [Bacillus thuringiensis]|uniref:murein hydrolase activator EnvC family protein n=1 Tax=Bacillus thuringiensis TaxID=1428 RepID=UPI0021D6953B|nr:M23 family metallopeptidase [Bacillus thuringiensis]MCU7667060.1 peptidoglycan DD-metalloendopeptidase family protein [Bacillus thuringiensis]
MNKHKKSQTLAFSFGITMLLVSQTAHAEDIKELQDKKLQLQQQSTDSANKKEELQQELHQVESEIQTLEMKLATLTKGIDSTNKEITTKETSIQNTEEEIKKILNVIKEKQIDLEQKKVKLEQNLKLMYSSGNVQFLEFLFRSDSLSQFLFRFEKYTDIMHKGEQLHSEVLEQINFIKTQKQLLEDKKLKIETEKTELETKKKLQESQKTEQKNVQHDLNAKKNQVQHSIDEEDEAMESLSSAIAEAEKSIQFEQAKIEEAKRIAKERQKQLLLQQQEKERQQQQQQQKQQQISSNSNESQPASHETGQSLGSSILAYPMKPGTYTLTSPYGYRIHPITGERKLHNGADFGAPRNTPIYAAEEGYVLYAGHANGYGNWIVIKHPNNGLYTIYGHMYDDGLYVSPGDYVFRGQKIGGVGSNGGSTGNHLHFCVATSFDGGKFSYANPLNYIN